MASAARLLDGQLNSSGNFILDVGFDSLKRSRGFPQNTLVPELAPAIIFVGTPKTINGVQCKTLEWHCVLEDMTC